MRPVRESGLSFSRGAAGGRIDGGYGTGLASSLGSTCRVCASTREALVKRSEDDVLRPDTDKVEMPFEAHLAIRCAQPEFGEEQAEQCRRELRDHAEDIAWERFVDIAYRQQVLPLVASRFINGSLSDFTDDPRLACPYLRLFKLYYEACHSRNEILLAEACRVQEALQSADVATVFRKGLVLITAVYRDLGARYMSDIDIAVPPGQLDRAVEAISSVGYLEGTPSARTVTPLTSEQRIYRRLHVPNRVLHRPMDRPFVDAVSFDLSMNMFLPDSGYSLTWPTADSNAEELVLSHDVSGAQYLPHWAIIDFSTHLFKEGKTLMFIEAANDITLRKVADMAAYIRSRANGSWATLLDLTRQLGIGTPVHYGLWHVERVFPGTIPSHVLPQLADSDEHLLTYGEMDGVDARWNEEWLARFYRSDARNEAASSQVKTQWYRR